jgi:hypothetical protein
LYIHDTGRYTPGHDYTPAEYALQKVVDSFGNVLSKLAEHLLTHTYTVVFCFCQIENIDYLVLRYINTGAVPFEQFSEETLFDGEAYSVFISEMVFATISIWRYLRPQRWT